MFSYRRPRNYSCMMKQFLFCYMIIVVFVTNQHSEIFSVVHYNHGIRCHDSLIFKKINGPR